MFETILIYFIIYFILVLAATPVVMAIIRHRARTELRGYTELIEHPGGCDEAHDLFYEIRYLMIIHYLSFKETGYANKLALRMAVVSSLERSIARLTHNNESDLRLRNDGRTMVDGSIRARSLESALTEIPLKIIRLRADIEHLTTTE